MFTYKNIYVYTYIHICLHIPICIYILSLCVAIYKHQLPLLCVTIYFLPYRNYQTPDRYTKLGLTSPMTHDKTFHLSLVQDCFNVSPSEILFIDDDLNNCLSASHLFAYTLHVVGNRGFRHDAIEVVHRS
eukprot:GHVQ01020506.1.p1 GENE.GHVQ01020506.1~~GHVQ01020506.1.p1  ORF type:complete len:130 (+),score=1.80 GHVQ01020506.1:3-392(+)